MYRFKDYWKKSTVTFKKHVEIKKGKLEIAPLIDVVFLLLIFFMLTSSFVKEPAIDIKIPKAITGQILQEKSAVITIDSKGAVYLDGREVEADDLKDRLKELAADEKSLRIRADEKTRIGKVVEVWDLCREVGIAQVSIATTTPD